VIQRRFAHKRNHACQAENGGLIAGAEQPYHECKQRADKRSGGSGGQNESGRFQPRGTSHTSAAESARFIT